LDVSISHDALGELYAGKLRSKGKLAIANYNHTSEWEKPDVVTWSGGFSLHVVEVKVSRSDFKRDFDKPWRQTDSSQAESQKRQLERAWERHKTYLAEHASKQMERQRVSDEFRDARGFGKRCGPVSRAGRSGVTPSPASTCRASEYLNVSTSAVLVAKRRNEIATNWVKRP
jgi:hypothetical protein